MSADNRIAEVEARLNANCMTLAVKYGTMLKPEQMQALKDIYYLLNEVKRLKACSEIIPEMRDDI